MARRHSKDNQLIARKSLIRRIDNVNDRHRTRFILQFQKFFSISCIPIYKENKIKRKRNKIKSRYLRLKMNVTRMKKIKRTAPHNIVQKIKAIFLGKIHVYGQGKKEIKRKISGLVICNRESFAEVIKLKVVKDDRRIVTFRRILTNEFDQNVD